MSALSTIKKNITVPRMNLALVVILVTFVCYTLFAPITPAVYGKPQIQNANNLYAGHTLTYRIHACRKVGDGVVTTITRQLVSTTDKQLQPINLNTDIITNPSKCQTSAKTLIIPYSVPEGNYRLLIRGIYAIMPMRKPITVSAESDPITIHSASVSQEIQDLIEANDYLQGQLNAQVPQANGSTSTTTDNNNGTSTTSTNTNSTTTSNNAPAKNSTPAPTPPTTPAPTTSGGGTNPISEIIKALGGGGINIGL